MKTPLLTALFAAAAFATPAPQHAALARALTLHASSEAGLDADFARGDKVCYVRTKTGLVLGAAYVGHLDDLAVFDRALTDAEVKQLMALKNGVRDLRP
jgi:hypothetical protein